jgi:raffinose/stachyose/melibiose transport system permease protein
MSDKKAVVIFLLPSFILFCAVIIIPIFMSAGYSLTEWDGTRAKVFIGLQNYKELFSSPVFLKSMLNSLIIAVASVLIQLPLSLLLALCIAHGVKGEKFFITVFFIPVILASVVIGQLWARIYNQNGLLNLFLRALGDKDAKTAWLGGMKTALPAVIVPILWQYVGYHMLLFYSGIRSISQDIFEAAKIDGASFWRTCSSITIPLLKPIIEVSVTFAVVGSMKTYDLVKVLTNGGPASASEVITTLLVRTMFYPGNRYGYGSAMAIALIAECFLLYLALGRIFREKPEKLEKPLKDERSAA